MITYKVTPNQEQIGEAISLFKFLGGNSSDAVRIAINKAGPKIRTLSSSEIRSQVRLKASYLNGKDSTGKQRLSFVRATKSKLTGAIQTPSRGLLLSRFSTDSQISGDKVGWYRPPEVPPRGIRVKVKPSGSPQPVTGGSDADGSPFYMVLKNSRALGIAVRRKDSGPNGGKLKVLYGPSVSQVFTDVKDKVTPAAGEEYERQLLDSIRYLLQKKYPPEAP